MFGKIRDKKKFQAICDIADQKQISRNLEDARIAARNVLEDLQVEKEKLAEAKAKDEALLESMGEGVVAINQDGKVIVMNKIAENILGLARRELIGKSFIEAVVLEDSQGNKVPETERPIILSMTNLSQAADVDAYYFVSKDGRRVPVAITATPILLNGKLTGAIIVFRDITKEKEIEKLRVDFLSLASHQLRTPLSGTKWLIDTMRGEVLGLMTKKQKEYLNYIYQINERMIKLVSEMLNVLMLEGNVAMVKKQKISVFKLYEGLFLMMEPAAKSKKITLRNLPKNYERLFIQSDPKILQSILENFISNAINYSQDGQQVLLGIKEESDAVIFFVKDSGIGIPKEEQIKISERFYRAANAKKFRPDGTGLGLHAAFLLAQKIGGKIWFESKDNKGTTFYLQVPKQVDPISNFNNNQTK